MSFGSALAEDITIDELCKYAGYSHMLGDMSVYNEVLHQAFAKIIVQPGNKLEIETRRCWDLVETSKKLGLPTSESDSIAKKIISFSVN
jgi:hypothetical protein